MADVIRIASGSLPWRPTADSDLVKRYRQHDIPLTGLVEQHSLRYLFHCLAGELDETSIWLYVLVGPDDERTLDETPALFELDRWLSTYPGPGVLAVAREGSGVLTWMQVDSVDEGALSRALDQLIYDLPEGAQAELRETFSTS